MTDDERAIRSMIETWMQASKEADLPTLLSLMADDIVFMTPGRPPFGKEEFAESVRPMMSRYRMEGKNEIVELKVLGDWAYMRCHISVSMIPDWNAAPMNRSGYTLTILKKTSKGWVIARDANLMTAESKLN